jgi:hypothetical protein
MGSRHLFFSPDTVSLDRTQRSKALKDIESRALSWRADSAYHIPRDVTTISFFSSYSRKNANNVGTATTQY